MTARPFPPPGRARVRLAAGLALAAVVLVSAPRARAAGVAEYAVKAAFVYNFARFSEWPDGTLGGPETPFTVCVADDQQAAQAFRALEGKEVHGHRVRVRAPADPAAPSGCAVFFEPGVGRPGVPRGRPTLTVGQRPGFAGRGGMVNFFLVDGKVRFEINLQAVRDAGLSMSSQLLKLARIVQAKGDGS